MLLTPTVITPMVDQFFEVGIASIVSLLTTCLLSTFWVSTMGLAPVTWTSSATLPTVSWKSAVTVDPNSAAVGDITVRAGSISTNSA